MSSAFFLLASSAVSGSSSTGEKSFGWNGLGRFLESRLTLAINAMMLPV
jgi:hypothetical protein